MTGDATPGAMAPANTAKRDADALAIRAIGELHSTWVRAVRDGDVSALCDLVTEDYEVWANGAPPSSGREAVAAAMGAAVALYTVEQALESLELVIAGDWAFERGVERVTVTPRGAGPAQTRVQRALLILHRGGDGKWRYARGMTNSLPASAPAEA